MLSFPKVTQRSWYWGSCLYLPSPLSIWIYHPIWSKQYIHLSTLPAFSCENPIQPAAPNTPAWLTPFPFVQETAGGSLSSGAGMQQGPQRLAASFPEAALPATDALPAVLQLASGLSWPCAWVSSSQASRYLGLVPCLQNLLIMGMVPAQWQSTKQGPVLQMLGKRQQKFPIYQ